MQHVECGPVEWYAATEEHVQHHAEAPHVDGHPGVRNRVLCTSLGAEQQFRGGAVLIAASRRKRRGVGGHRAGDGDGGDRCTCKVRDDGTAVSCLVGRRGGGVDADEDIFEF